MLRLVIIPQALKPMMAPYVNQSVTQLKNTSLVSVIAVPDLVYNATLINADTYRPLEVYTVVALIYFAILFPATLVGRRSGAGHDLRQGVNRHVFHLAPLAGRGRIAQRCG